MHWFGDNIPSAIAQSRQKSLVFLVYISGNDEISSKMDATVNDERVTELCEKNCVAVKLQANSEQCVQFSAIYPVVCVPCTYFIGQDGKPLEITAGHQEPAAFVTTLNSVIQKHQTQLATRTRDQNQASSAEGDRGAASSGATEEKVERATELIKAKQAQKEVEAKEKEKNDELQRRQLGKDLQKLKEQQEEMEKKEAASNLKREKEEERLARERVKEQIARDRAERAAAFAKEKAEREAKKEEDAKVKAVAKMAEQARNEAQAMESARIQFRLPDGSFRTQTFPSSQTLAEARDWLQENTQGQYGVGCSLVVAYPRRELSEADLTSTLLDLNLAPSAAIIFLPRSRRAAPGPLSASSPSDGGLLSLLTLLLFPFVWLGNLLLSLFTSPSPSSHRPPAAGDGRQGATSSQPHSQLSDSGGARPRTSVRSRQEGNIRRLNNSMDDDEDMTTYNGNSTQQM